MKTFREFIYDSYKPTLEKFYIILENFVSGNINVDSFLYLLEGDFQSENAFRYIWNLASTDAEVKDLLNQASTLLHGVDAPEPKKYVKKVSDEWKSWEKEHKSLRDRIKEIRSSTELSRGEKGRQIQRIEAEIKSHNDSEPNRYSLRKGSKEINPEWTKWASSRSENPEEDQKSAKELMSRISSIMRDRISAARNDPSNPLNFNNADPSDFTKGKTPTDSQSYYDNLEANIDAVSISPAYRELRGKAGKWSAERTGNAQAELSKQAKLGDISQGYQPSPKNEGETNKDYVARIKREKREYEQGIQSPIQKADATLTDPSNPSSYIGISHKKGPYQLSAGEPRELLSVGKAAAKEVAKKEIQIPQGVKVTKELKDEIRRKREERVEELMGRIRQIADLTSYRGRDREEMERRKEEAQSLWDNLVGKDSKTSEPEFIKAYTARQKTGEDRYASQTGTANVMVQVPDPKLSTEKKPHGTEITTTANRGAKKIVTPSASGGKSSSNPDKPARPMTNRQRVGFAPEKDIQDLELPQAGPTQADVARDLAQAKRQQLSFSTFLKKAEQSVAQAQQAVAAAEAEKQSAQNELETNPDGTKTYRQHQAQKRINNPNLNARLTTADQAVQTANMTFVDIQARAAQAKERLAAQSQQQKPEVQQQRRTEPVDTKPQQPTTAPAQPQQPQPTQTPSSTQPQQTQTQPPEQQQQQPAPEPKKKKPKPKNMETADQASQ